MYRTKQNSTTGREYTDLEAAYDFYSERLFEGALPPCLITYQRKANAQGYFSRARFESRAAEAVAGGTTDEIALNPDVFGRKTDREILSTLVHEMAHLWQYHFGNPGRMGYHNAEWAGRMETLGLMPSSTGQPGGKRTGQGMSHYIVEGGPFDLATDELLTTGWRLNWQSPAGEKKPRDSSKTKYTCNCGQAAWGKLGLAMVCGLCAGAFLPADNPSPRPMFIVQPLTDDEYRRQCEAQGLFIGGSRDLGGEADNDDLAEGAA